jgi:phosphonate transport system substrate-binding protein
MFVRLRAAAVLFTIAVATALPPAAHAEPKEGELLFGSVAMDIPAVMHKRLKPLADYLGGAIGRPVQLHLSPNMPAAIEEVATARVDLAYLTPVAYIRAHDAGQAQLVVKTVTKGKSSFRLMIVVREDSPIKSVRDLAGKSFAFGDKAALLQRAVVVGAGIGLEEFGEYRFIGHYDNIVRGVLSGDFDAGILKDTMAYNWSGKGIRILHSSPDLPPYNISASRGVGPATLDAVREALLKLDATNPDHRPVIAALDKNYDGFTSTSDEEYDVVRQLIAPFKDE